MRITKVFNNNIVLALDERKQECVVIGRGIAYGKRPGDNAELSASVKVFKPMERGLAEKLISILDDIPFEHIKVCNEIVDMARQQLGKIDEKVYFTLIDHIAFAVERHTQGMEFENAFWEIRHLYPDEYRAGRLALDIIESRLGVRFPDSEAAFLAFHFLNSRGVNTQTAKDSVRLVREILEIVHRAFPPGFDTESLHYTRFITHLRFLASRLFQCEQADLEPAASTLLTQALEHLTEERCCMDSIEQYVHAEFRYRLTADEKNYLMIHLHNLVRNSSK